jgi:hypothetical protein
MKFIIELQSDRVGRLRDEGKGYEQDVQSLEELVGLLDNYGHDLLLEKDRDGVLRIVVVDDYLD